MKKSKKIALTLAVFVFATWLFFFLKKDPLIFKELSSFKLKLYPRWSGMNGENIFIVSDGREYYFIDRSSPEKIHLATEKELDFRTTSNPNYALPKNKDFKIEPWFLGKNYSLNYIYFNMDPNLVISAKNGLELLDSPFWDYATFKLDDFIIHFGLKIEALDIDTMSVMPIVSKTPWKEYFFDFKQFGHMLYQTEGNRIFVVRQSHGIGNNDEKFENYFFEFSVEKKKGVVEFKKERTVPIGQTHEIKKFVYRKNIDSFIFLDGLNNLYFFNIQKSSKIFLTK